MRPLLMVLVLSAGCVAEELPPNDAVLGFWSFRGPIRPKVPATARADWARNPIDSYVLARLEAEGLSPAPEVGRAQLIRRLSLDLRGLPPTPEEVEAFVSDPSPSAPEALIDRLLVAPETAENWARDWMDLARYADSNGYQVDLERSMWPWRDWVISAFQEGMPIDRFIRLQLAGDLGAEPWGALASGFNRNHAVSTEGGVIDEEYRTIYAMDRVNTIGTVFLGLTVGCARCHDHKYDPLTMRDYYRMLDCFRQIDDAGKANDNGFSPTASTRGPLWERRARALEDALRSIPADLDATLEEAERLAEPELAATGPVSWVQAEELRAEAMSGEALSVSDDAVVGPAAEIDRYTISMEVPLRSLRAVRLEALTDSALPSGGPGRGPGGAFGISEVDLWLDGPHGRQRVELLTANSDGGEGSARLAIDGSGSTAWSPPPGPKAVIFGLAEPLDAREGRLTLRISQLAGGGRTLGKLRLSFSEHVLAALPPGLDAALLLRPAERRPEADHALIEHFGLYLAGTTELALARERLRLTRHLADAEPKVNAMVMKAPQAALPTYVLVRGDYQRHSEQVSCGVPSWLRAGKKGPMSRADFAEWLLDPGHPLTARVWVNRVWQRYFGIGLVKTIDNLGHAGERPSHPALLDWLARERVDSGWDARHLHRLILSSATYRQSSLPSREAEARDPENRLLSHAARFRLPAEVIRDDALSAAGILDSARGGPPVMPEQPAGLWEDLNDREGLFTPYRTDSGDRTHRRSLYLFWKRSMPPPSMTIFDAPTRESCTAARSITNTPLQALYLMNAPEMLEAAAALGLRMVREAPGSTDDWIRRGFFLVTSRAPTDAELRLLLSAYEAQRVALETAPEQAERLQEVGEATRISPLRPEVQGAVTQVARVLLNLSETITRE